MPPVHLLTQSSADGVISSALNGLISQLSPDGEKISSFQFFVQPISLAFLPSKQLLVVAYEHPQGESWPEIQDKLFGHQERSFDWNTFYRWIGTSTAVALVWAFLALYFSRSKPVAVPAAPQLESNHSSRPWLHALWAFTLLGMLTKHFWLVQTETLGSPVTYLALAWSLSPLRYGEGAPPALTNPIHLPR